MAFNRRVAKAIDRNRVRLESARYFEAFKRLQGEDGRPLESTKSDVPIDPELAACLNAIPKPQPNKKKNKRPEAKVVHSCLDLLHALHIFAWRNNTGAVAVGKRYIRYGLKGSSDILGIMPGGRFLAVECKSDVGVQSDSQKHFQQRVEASGGLYFLVSSATQLSEKLNEYKTNG